MENQIVIRKGSAISNRQGSSKIQIRKTDHDTRITLCDVRFTDIEKWNVEEMNRIMSTGGRMSINDEQELTNDFVKITKGKTGAYINDTLDNYMDGQVREKTNTFMNANIMGRLSSYGTGQPGGITRGPNGAVSFMVKSKTLLA